VKNLFFVFSLALFALAASPASALDHRCGATLGPKQGKVDSTCKPASKITCVKGGPAKTCAQYTATFEAAKACKAARLEVNKCFAAPDKGHLDAVKVVGAEVANCQTLMQSQCAAEKRAANPPKPKAAAAAPAKKKGK
jgi:hypothetical protein